MIDKLYGFIARHINIIVPLLLVGVICLYGDFIAQKFATKSWKIEAFYSALFDWSSIISAFLFGVYAFVLGRSEPFMRAVEKTKAFHKARDYIRHTVFFTLAQTALMLPLVVIQPNIRTADLTDIGFTLFVLICVSTCYFFMRLCKIIRVFRLLETK